MIDAETALDALRLDADLSSTGLVGRWIETLPSYIESATGVPSDTVRESEDKLLEALEIYLVMLWHCPDGTDSDRLRVVVESLEKTIAARHVAERERS